jgi:hypothetical protein
VAPDAICGFDYPVPFENLRDDPVTLMNSNRQRQVLELRPQKSMLSSGQPTQANPPLGHPLSSKREDITVRRIKLESH